MANVTAKLFIRCKQEGKEKWVAPTGKDDPAGTFYIRYYEGTKTAWQRLPEVRSYRNASDALLRFTMTLKRKAAASELGITLPGEEPAVIRHTWQECLDAFIQMLTTKHRHKRGGWRYKPRGIRARKSEIEQFADFAKRTYVEEYTTADMLAYKEHLYSLGRANDSSTKSVVSITGSKNNGLVRIVATVPG